MLKNGISTGLTLWLFFLAVFVLLGYSVPLSIMVGAIGGLSGGRIVTWWHSKDTPPPERSPEESEEMPLPKNRRMGIVEAQKSRKIPARSTPRGHMSLLQQIRRSLQRR